LAVALPELVDDRWRAGRRHRAEPAARYRLRRPDDGAGKLARPARPRRFHSAQPALPKFEVAAFAEEW
jgi:hypothetical protein